MSQSTLPATMETRSKCEQLYLLIFK